MERTSGIRTNNRLRVVVIGTAALTSAFWAACTDRTQPPRLPSMVPSTAAPREIPSVPASPTPERPLTDQELNLAKTQIEDMRILIDSYVNTSILKKYPSTAIVDFPLPSAKIYNRAVENWARYKSVDATGKNPFYILRTSPSGILHYDITNTYDDSGKNTQSSIVVNLSSSSDYKKVLPEIGKFLEEETIKDQNGSNIKLPIKRANLAPLAEALFNLPPTPTWHQSTVKYQDAIIPAIATHFISSKGEPVGIVIDARGLTTLSVGHT